LPTPGNPFLVEHWLRNYEQVWKGEVDELRVNVNAQYDPAIRDAIREAVERRGAVYMEGKEAEHGFALRELVDATEADVVLLCEDDCRVRIEGHIARRFERIERNECDVIGSPRGSMTVGLNRRASEVFGEKVSMTADARGFHGHGMWPAFVFARRSALLATDQWYGAQDWQPGEEVLGLDWQTRQFECSDTFGATALQLRKACRVEHDVQYKGPDGWDEWLHTHDMPWFHIGSLSSWQFNGEFLHATPASRADMPQWAHRFAWWRRVFETTAPAFPDLRERYASAWEAYRQHIGIDTDLIDSWVPLLDRMVTWDEYA
jgi:hypothetical protein